MKLKSSLAFVIVLTSLAAYAQDSVKTLTFKEAVEIALRNNVTLNQQKNTLFQARAQKTYGIAQLGPQVSASGNLYRNDGNSFIQQRAEVVNAVVDVVQAQLRIQMPLFNGLSGISQMRQYSSAMDAQLHQVKRSTQDVINNVSSQYLQVLLDMELLRIAKENAEAQKKQYEFVKAQVEVGSRSPVDEYNQQALVSNADVQVARAEYTLVNDKMTLFQTLVVDPTIKTNIEEPSWDANAIGLNELTLEQLLAVAADNRADLKQFKSNENASKYAMQARKGNFFPSINAFYNYGSAYNQVRGTPKDSLYRDFRNQFLKDNRYTTVGLSFSIPIFTGFQNRANYVQSKVTYENNKLLTKNREVLVKADVVKAYENFVTVKRQYTAGLTGLQASEVAYRLEKERFDLGITSFVDLANANRAYVQAQTDMAQAKYRFLFQKIMLDYAAGTLKVEDVAQY
jgi:outer membrane protein